MPDHLTPGQRIGGRYLLEAELGRGSVCSVWRAHDERLERRVALRVFDLDADRPMLEERAGLAASLTHQRVVRIFDTGFDAGHFFTVSELLPGCLAWAGLPLPAEEAVDLASQIVAALDHAHQRGIAHGGLHPGNVLLSEQGAKVADFTLSGSSLESTPEIAGDLIAFGRLLYLVLTGTRPGEPGPGGKPLPDQPRGLSRVVTDLMEGRYETAAEVRQDLAAVKPIPVTAPRTPVRVLLAVALAVLATGLVLGATRLGERPEGTPAPQPGLQITGVPLEIATVQDFDPLGDGRENRHTVENLYDGDPQTFWSTERYRAGADFSGLKTGVGVILDLGEPEVIGKAQILFASPGCSYEIRYSPIRSTDPDAWETVAAVQGSPSVSGVEFPASTSRWWLLWITRLTQGVPGARGAYACGVAEVELFRP